MSTIYYIGLDVHKHSIAVLIARSHSTDVRKYGVIGGTVDALDKLSKSSRMPMSNSASFTKLARAATSPRLKVIFFESQRDSGTEPNGCSRKERQRRELPWVES